MKDTKRTGTMTGSGAWSGSMPSNAWDKDENTFWQNKFQHEGYFQNGMTWDDYEPAYRYGFESHNKWHGRKWDDVEHDMGSEWDKMKAKSRLKWEHAKFAVKAVWDRMENKMHGEHAAHH